MGHSSETVQNLALAHSAHPTRSGSLSPHTVSSHPKPPTTKHGAPLMPTMSNSDFDDKLREKLDDLKKLIRNGSSESEEHSRFMSRIFVKGEEIIAFIDEYLSTVHPSAGIHRELQQAFRDKIKSYLDKIIRIVGKKI
jgi:hypothetical protein